MKRLVWAVAALLGFAAQADFNTALDCNELTFTTGGNANWFEQTTEAKIGESAMRSGSITSGQQTWIETTIPNDGMLSFWWKTSSEEDYDELSVTVGNAQMAAISGTGGGWSRKSISVAAGRTVRWVYAKDESEDEGSDCAWLDGVEFMPAPESMTVTFVTNGGDEIAPTNVAPGVTYGELPVPHREGDSEFDGWCLDENLTEKARSGDLVEFRNHTLYAKWSISVSVLNADGLEFSTYDDTWRLPWEVVAEAGASGGYAVRGPVDLDYTDGYLYLSTTNGSGTLSYKWKIDGGSGSGSFEECNTSWNWRYYYFYSDAGDDWQTRTVCLYGDSGATVGMQWRSASQSAALMLSDFVWTPAPESMTITFEANGADEIAPTNVAPGITYGELPVPQKEGVEEFGGWYLDEELTERAPDYELVAFRDHTLYAKWLLPVSLLNGDGLEFYTYYDEDWTLPWEAVAESGASGGYAVRGPIRQDSADGRLYLCVYGVGSLTYKWRIDGTRGTFREYNYKDDSNYYFYGYGKDWQTRTLCLYGDDEEGVELEWTSSGKYTALMLSDFVWAPAPETITVSFDANGGTLSGADSRTYGPRETYGRDGDEKLPVPTRNGFTFLGWREESVSGRRVADTDRVPWRDAVTLVAKWGAAVSAFNTTILTKFTSSGADKWYAVNENCMGTVAEVEPKGRVKTVKGMDNCGGDYSYKTIEPTVSVLQTPIAKEGFLSFQWSLKNGGATESGEGEENFPSASIVFYLDGSKIAEEQVWYYDEETDARQVYVYVPAGKHTLKWEVKGQRAYYWSVRTIWNDETEDYDEVETEELGSEPVVRVWGFKFEPAGPQPDLQAWAGKVKTYKNWRTGDLARFAALYKTRMIADGEDYEARILYAATRLGALAENAQFKTYAKTFGMTIDWARMNVTPPSPKFDKDSAAVNAMVDNTIALATPAIQDAQAALAGIPEDWDGSVELDSDNWPIDETVSLDIADVLFARAGLDAALAGLNYMGAHDLTVNWPKVSAVQKLETMIPVVSKLPAIGDEASWEKSAQNFRTGTVADGDKGDGVGAVAISGNTLSLRLASPFEEGWLNDTNLISNLNFKIRTADRSLELRCYLDYEDASKTNVSCYVYDTKSDDDTEVKATLAIRESELVLSVDLKSLNFGTKKKPVGFSKKSWSIDGGYVTIVSFGDDEDGDYWWVQRGYISWERPDDGERRVMKFINDQTALFSKVRDAARLSASRRYFKAALVRALEADAKATARPEGGDLHFFEYDPDDKPLIDFARTNTQRALQCLDGPTVIDFNQVAAEWEETGAKFKASDYNFSLLPDEGMTRIYLGALFEGRISRDLLPPMRTNIYGEIVPDFDAMQDPTIGGLIPDMTHECIAKMSGRFETVHELDHGEPSDLESLPKPGEKLVLDYAEYKGYTASGLPKGWKWDSKKGVLTGTAASTFTVTFAKKGKPSVKETIEVGPKPAVLLFSDNEAAVAVTGTGLYNVGATAKAVAAVKNGYAFGGWYDEDGDLVSPLAVYSFKMPREDVSLMATTIPLGEDGLYANPAEEPYGLELGVDCGDLTPFQTMSVSPFSVSVAGLPPGLLASNVVEIAADGFYGDMHVTGVPTKKGVYYATFVAKNNGGFRRTAVVKFVVGGAEEEEANTANINWDSYADGEGESDNYWASMWAGIPFEAILDVPNSPVCSAPVSAVATKTVKKKATNTLPTGLSASFKNGRIMVSGVPSTPGKFTIEFTVTYKNKKTAKAVKTVVVKDSGSVYIPTGVVDNDPNGAVRGTVAYVGVKQYGQTVKFTATTKDKKNWFFGGWFLDEGLENPADVALPGIDYRTATVSAQIGEMWSSGDGMFARFVTKDEEAEEGLAIDCEDFWRVRDDETGELTQLPINGVVSATKPTLSASGLPAGTKLSGMKLVVSKASALVPGWYTVTLTAKTAAGNTVKKVVDVLVPNITEAIEAEVLSGLNTSDNGYSDDFMQAGVKQTFTLEDLDVSVADGWTLAVTGLPKGWTYNAGTKTFTGVATKVGKTTVTFTVSKKVGKKTTSYKATATFDLASLPTWATGAFVGQVGNAYVRMDVASNGAISGYCSDAAGKKTFTATGFTAKEDGAILSAVLKGTGASLQVDVCAYENLGISQGRADFDAGVAFNSPWAIDGASPLPDFADGAVFQTPYGSGTLTLKFGQNGVVAYTYTVGNNATSGSTQICSLTWNEEGQKWSAEVAIALAKKIDKNKKILVPALVDTIPLSLKAGENNIVQWIELD